MLCRALLRVPLRPRLYPSATQFHCDLISGPLVLSNSRTYSTPGRPKSVVGEPSRPVKRAVKRAARQSPAGDTAAEDVVRATRRKAAKKPKKLLTPEQKAAKRERKKIASEKTKVRELKSAALNPPANSQPHAYQVFIAEKMPEKLKSTSSSEEDTPAGKRRAIGAAMRAVAGDWKQLSAAELEHYNHVAVQKREVNAAEYKRWVETHSADEIYRANLARAQLRHKLGKDAEGGKGKERLTKWAKIVDERAVKRPLTAFAQFSVNRHASGDFKNITLSDRSKLISQEWKSLSEDEKQKYHDLQNQDRDRYAAEFKDVYGYETTAPRSAAA